MRADHVVIKKALGAGGFKRAYLVDVFDNELEECRREVMVVPRGGFSLEENVHQQGLPERNLSYDDKKLFKGERLLRKERRLLESLSGIEGVPESRPYSSDKRIFTPFETEWTLQDHILTYRDNCYEEGGASLWHYAKDFIQTMCDATLTLEMMGDQGVVTHGDIKPANFLALTHKLDYNECSIRVLDYGSVIHEDFRYFPRRSMMTTRGYAPPEFYRFWPHANHNRGRDLIRPNEKSDVYMLGMCLWEGLTPGANIYKDVMTDDFFLVMGMPSIYPNYCAIGMSTDIDEIIMNSIQWSPKDRWSRKELLGRLDDLFQWMSR